MQLPNSQPNNQPSQPQPYQQSYRQYQQPYNMQIPPPSPQDPYSSLTAPYYPQPGQIPSSPTPPKKRRKTKGCLIGCGTVALLLFVIVSCSAIVSGSHGTGSANIAAGTTVIATMPPQKTADTTTVKTQPTTLPRSKPTQSPIQPTIEPPTPTLVPTNPPAQPTQPPVQPTKPPACQGVNGNPWCYNFNAAGGTVITSPPAAFCSGQYFSCIPTFANGVGYVVECVDGLYAISGGRSGSCSHHGGDKAILYSH